MRPSIRGLELQIAAGKIVEDDDGGRPSRTGGFVKQRPGAGDPRLPVARVRPCAVEENEKRLLRQALTVWMRLPVPVTGARLRAAGVKAGPGLGEALRRTRDAVLDGEVVAEKAVEHALAVAARLGGMAP